MSYFVIGGKADRLEFEAFFDGIMRPDRFQYDVLAQSINEHFMDRGDEYRVPYAGQTSADNARNRSSL